MIRLKTLVQISIKFIDVKKVLNREDNPLKYFPNQSFGHYTGWI